MNKAGGPAGPRGATGPSGPPFTVLGNSGTGSLAIDPTLGIIAPNNRRTLMYVHGLGGAADLTGLARQISAGYQDCDELVLVCTDDLNSLTLGDGSGLRMNRTRTLGNGTQLSFFWDIIQSFWRIAYDNGL